MEGFDLKQQCRFMITHKKDSLHNPKRVSIHKDDVNFSVIDFINEYAINDMGIPRRFINQQNKKTYYYKGFLQINNAGTKNIYSTIRIMSEVDDDNPSNYIPIKMMSDEFNDASFTAFLEIDNEVIKEVVKCKLSGNVNGIPTIVVNLVNSGSIIFNSSHNDKPIMIFGNANKIVFYHDQDYCNKVALEQISYIHKQTV